MHQLNEDIRDSEIRLIGSTGEQLGIMSAAQAQHIADEQGLDLVKISPQATPPVCKLMDYGKFRFEQGKREKEAKKNQHVVEIKEIRMSPGIDVGDFNTKLKNAQKFLADGNRVKVSVRFRGREMAHTEIGRDLLTKFAEQCGEVASMEKAAKMEGRNMSIFLACAASIPDVQVLLMFIFPIKVKWLGIVYGIILLVNCIQGGIATWIVVIFSLLNFLVFFLRSKGKMHLSVGQIKRQQEFHQKMRSAGQTKGITRHKCAICGRTELDGDDLEFRFCSKCNGNYEYCQYHLFTHEHVK